MSLGLHTTGRSAWSPRALRVGTLAVIPVALLAVARDASLTTEMWPNGMAYRQLSVTVNDETTARAASEFVQREFGHWRHLRVVLPEGTCLLADQRIPHTDLPADVTAHRSTTMLVDLWTTYTFSEEIRPDRIASTAREQQLASLAAFTYELKMPGRIMETDPPTAQVDGGTARWRLTASADRITVKATSRQFKCGNATIMLYIALWALGWGSTRLYRRMRARPKRI